MTLYACSFLSEISFLLKTFEPAPKRWICRVIEEESDRGTDGPPPVKTMIATLLPVARRKSRGSKDRSRRYACFDCPIIFSVAFNIFWLGRSTSAAIWIPLYGGTAWVPAYAAWSAAIPYESSARGILFPMRTPPRVYGADMRTSPPVYGAEASCLTNVWGRGWPLWLPTTALHGTWVWVSWSPLLIVCVFSRAMCLYDCWSSIFFAVWEVQYTVHVTFSAHVQRTAAHIHVHPCIRCCYNHNIIAVLNVFYHLFTTPNVW